MPKSSAPNRTKLIVCSVIIVVCLAGAAYFVFGPDSAPKSPTMTKAEQRQEEIRNAQQAIPVAGTPSQPPPEPQRNPHRGAVSPK